tara:strand:+ start:222 stop:542 length:321 start_codon:yes stop_codon:yes gene_type:complete
MNKENFDMLSNHILDMVKTTRDCGQNEYARDTKDVLANFKRIGSWKNESQESVLLTYLLKHIDGIISHVNGHISQREDVKGRITDVIVYCMLLWAMVEEEDCSESI